MTEPEMSPAELLRYFQQLTESPAAELCRRGQAFATIGLRSAALEQFEKAVVADPAYGLAWSDLGVCLTLLDRLSEAEQALYKAIELAPDNFVSWGALGEVCVRLNRPDDARQCLEACRRIAPHDPRTERLSEMFAEMPPEKSAAKPTEKPAEGSDDPSPLRRPPGAV